jgi:hypothetical protein
VTGPAGTLAEPDRHLLELAAGCYERLGMTLDAARCYREAGSYRRAADLFVGLGEFHEAARDFVAAGQQDLAAWLLVHEAGDHGAARTVLAAADRRWSDVRPDREPARRPLRQRLVLVRCDVAAGAAAHTALPVLGEACVALARPGLRYDPYVEPWAVALAEAIGREDQAALVFAAAVRGKRHGAVQRWTEWTRRVLHAELILPPEALHTTGRPS